MLRCSFPASSTYGGIICGEQGALTLSRPAVLTGFWHTQVDCISTAQRRRGRGVHPKRTVDLNHAYQRSRLLRRYIQVRRKHYRGEQRALTLCRSRVVTSFYAYRGV